MNFTVYETSSGRILRTGYTVDPLANQVLSGESIVEESYDGETHYFSSGTLTARPANPTTIDKTSITADGVDAFTLSDYPTGAEIFIAGPVNYRGVLSAGFDDFTTTISGTYIVTVTAFPYLPQEYTVNAS